LTEKRWVTYIDPADLNLVRRHAAAHQLAPENVLIDGARAQLVDWAWRTLGAAFIGPRCSSCELINAGHTLEQAKAGVVPTTDWQSATAGR
jgi:hypothetical protein